MIYRPYRRKGYAREAFLLGTQYCFNQFKLACIYAGCYEDNIGSLWMLSGCGFIPHPEGLVVPNANCVRVWYCSPMRPGDQCEKHFLTGAEIVQRDFVKHNPDWVK